MSIYITYYMKITPANAYEYINYAENDMIFLEAAFMYVTELYIPDGIQYVNCWGNDLTQIEIPDSVTHFWGAQNPWDHDWKAWAQMRYSNLPLFII